MFNPQPKKYTPPKEKTRMKTVRTDNAGKLRRTLDTVFAKYIRKQSVKCFTCNGRAVHCGHYMKRGNDSVRWMESNCKPQCWECNVLKGGNMDVFRQRLIDEIGIEEVAAIEVLSRSDRKFSAPELQELIDKYSQKKAA